MLQCLLEVNAGGSREEKYHTVSLDLVDIHDAILQGSVKPHEDVLETAPTLSSSPSAKTEPPPMFAVLMMEKGGCRGIRSLGQ